ncbi:MAG TPA: tetratricopeptide repeat protein [Gammaproteobacteria bacterium]|nr:tetratricopeptide repeat protein [Gammaproteobacteria bacterium]
MYRLSVASTVALVALSVALPFEARAQPLGMAVQQCGAPRAPGLVDPNVSELAAAAERAIDTQQRNVWPTLGRLSMGACAMGVRDVVDRVFTRCFTECVDETDRYVAEIEYATTLERFGDALGAELHFQRAIALKDEPENALTAFTNYAAFLDRSGRPRDALELLNRIPANSNAARSMYPLKLVLMQKLGMQGSPEMAALTRAPPPFGRPPIDVPLSAIPAEDNPLAQRPFAKRIAVSADVTIEPRASATGVETAHLYYRRASMPDPSAFEATARIPRGETFDDIVDLGASGCRILWHGARYDIDDCPWRAGSTRAQEAPALYSIVDDKVRTQPAISFRPTPPVPLGAAPASEPAPEWMVWSDLYNGLVGARGVPTFLPAALLERAGLDAGDAAVVRSVGESYLLDLARVDGDLPREIADRYGPKPETAQPGSGGAVQVPAQIIVMGFGSSTVQIDRRALGGKTLQEALEADGVIARIDAQKTALLQAHFATLEQRIGAAKLTALQSRVRSDFAPNIQRSTRGVEIPRPVAQ